MYWRPRDLFPAAGKNLRSPCLTIDTQSNRDARNQFRSCIKPVVEEERSITHKAPPTPEQSLFSRRGSSLLNHWLFMRRPPSLTELTAGDGGRREERGGVNAARADMTQMAADISGRRVAAVMR